MKSPDVIIAGGGIIGLSVALELRRRGAAVLVLERGEPGQEATSAAAGMLAATDPETPAALRTLCSASARLYTEFVQRIESSSGMGVDFRTQGTIKLMAEDTSLPPAYRRLSPDERQQMEPSLKTSLEAFFVQEDSVDPSLLIQAALLTAWSTGVDVRNQSEVTEIVTAGPYAEVVAGGERMQVPNFVDCRGAWSAPPVRPRKGHSLYVAPKKSLLQHVLVSPDVYLVPRSTGQILIGATVEDVGYDKTVQANIVQKLRLAANMLIPELGAATEVESWAGLRPGTPDDLPLLGATQARGIFIASGHFRNGILLAPVTAQIMADLVTGKRPQWDISAFSPLRFTGSGETKTQRAPQNS
ncbi:MAG TPA: FAD-dependent oxidoreductase [Candidatus Angelobacter sp.]|nr:FAD-dependent oxidoreductase [Candidatus Angelobacter sp.]